MTELEKEALSALQDLQSESIVKALLSMAKMQWCKECTGEEALRTAAYALRVAREKAASI